MGPRPPENQRLFMYYIRYRELGGQKNNSINEKNDKSNDKNEVWNSLQDLKTT
jgi:hypothetical protein